MSRTKLFKQRVEELEKLLDQSEISEFDYQMLDTAARVEAGLLTFDEMLSGLTTRAS